MTNNAQINMDVFHQKSFMESYRRDRQNQHFVALHHGKAFRTKEFVLSVFLLIRQAVVKKRLFVCGDGNSRCWLIAKKCNVSFINA